MVSKRPESRGIGWTYPDNSIVREEKEVTKLLAYGCKMFSDWCGGERSP